MSEKKDSTDERFSEIAGAVYTFHSTAPSLLQDQSMGKALPNTPIFPSSPPLSTG